VSYRDIVKSRADAYLPYAPIHTRIIRDAIFSILCYEEKNYQHRVVALWNLQKSMLRSFGAHEVVSSLQTVLALEGTFVSFRKHQKVSY
jgi:hypothetical protein